MLNQLPYKLANEDKSKLKKNKKNLKSNLL